MIDMSKRRKITVDDKDYKWLVTSSETIFIWDQNGKSLNTKGLFIKDRTSESIVTGWCSQQPITPFDIANLIKTLENKPKTEKIQIKPSQQIKDAIRLNKSKPKNQIITLSSTQDKIYALVEVYEYFDEDAGYKRSVEKIISASLDPSVPKKISDNLNSFLKEKGAVLSLSLYNFVKNNVNLEFYRLSHVQTDENVKNAIQKWGVNNGLNPLIINALIETDVELARTVSYKAKEIDLI